MRMLRRPATRTLRRREARVEFYAAKVTPLALDYQAVLASLDHPLDAAKVGAALLSALGRSLRLGARRLGAARVRAVGCDVPV